MTTETATVCVIMTVGAADDDELREMIDNLRHRGFDVEVRVAWESGDAQRYAEQAAADGVDAIAACGGDGTLHEVLNAVMPCEPRPMMGGLPYGTGNDFLNGVGIQAQHGPEQFEQWLDIKPTPIDVGYVNDHYFLNMATAGIGAEVTAEASHQLKDVVGNFAYFVRAIPAAFDIPTHRARLVGEEFEWQGELAFLFVGNGRQTGGGWNVCPQAKIDDGLLDVVIVPAMPLSDMARHGRDMVNASTTGEFGPIVYRQLAQVEVDFEDQIPLNLDGEPIQGRHFQFCALPSALRFLLPPRQS